MGNSIVKPKVRQFAPVYATLVIGYLEGFFYEKKINAKYSNQFTNALLKKKWKRFLDDCFIT